MATEFEIELFMYSKTHAYYEAFKKFYENFQFVDLPKDLEDHTLAKSIITLIERYSTYTKTRKNGEIEFTRKDSHLDRKNQENLELLENYLDQYVEIEEIKDDSHTEYRILSLSKIPLKIKTEIIDTANKKTKSETKFEK